MNAETKLALVFLAILAVGLTLLFVGLGLTLKPVLVVSGLVLTWSATVILAGILSRR